MVKGGGGEEQHRGQETSSSLISSFIACQCLLLFGGVYCSMCNLVYDCT